MNDRRRPGFVPVPEVGDGLPDIVDDVESGELTSEQAAERLQQAARREAAEHGPTLDTNEDGRITIGGPGSGQGMKKDDKPN